ncbi:MAG: sulfatase-like hydrolase/transferase [Kiritimatiellia bacterium]
MKKPNILFLMTDQQRWDCVGANGNKLIQTPHLDALARDSVNFSHSFASAMACVPSRACIMTGQHVTAHGVRSTAGTQWLQPGTPTLPGVFRDHGYHTVSVGKTHFKPWHSLWGFERRVAVESKYDISQGKDEYRVVLRELGLSDKTVGHHTPGFGAAFKSMASSELPPDYYIDSYIGRRGVETLNEVTEDGHPFFLAVSFCGPHDPFDPPPPYSEMYDHEKMPTGLFREGELECLPEEILSKVRDMGKEHLDLTRVPLEKRKEIAAHYYGNISLIDDWVGRLIDGLKQKGLYQDTLIVFTSDHGEYLGDHSLYYKGFFPCDSDTRVPLIIKAPGFSPGICPELVGNVSLMPTLLDLCGLPIPDTVQGRSVKKIMKGSEPGDEAVVTFSEQGPAWRIRTKEWAYVYREGHGHDQLYNLADDPHELENLAENSDQSEQRHCMLRLLFKHLAISSSS